MPAYLFTAFISAFLITACASLCIEPATRTVFEFPFRSWVENIAVRAKGDLLVTLIDHPELHLINPFKPNNTTIVSSFPNVLGLLGIAEYDIDQFAVVAGNWSYVTDETTAHSYSIWRVDMRRFEAIDGEVLQPAVVEKVVDIPEAIFLNGMTTLSSIEKTILVSDSGIGAVWRVDIANRGYQVVIEDKTMEPGPPYNLGINGLHLRDHYLYYTNSALELFCRMPVKPDGTSAGNAEVLVTNHLGDDFTFDRSGNAYVTQDPGNALYKVTFEGNVSTILGGPDDPLIEGDTAAQFGRTVADSHILYITTNGGLVNPVDGPAVGGKVVAFNTRCA
ncbi:hypothetical protein BGW36DRAFT_387931 [Talaromyces proteolyticus]|uniref:SMP-30/Gluconolactonase/LRE-like region domain-containing protein n=1 Tax=Talaromyces proteolyticus TaxID=1131652 RepID=A0AAD4KG16_9EURO|nr:uncharacterized protein BGW36DRAFT_387931 [Talaromyces proteolyticus]KAH8691244.1 hypothetical protein BGW36DRAFT_387931 [Talaromyces proteolyticus]